MDSLYFVYTSITTIGYGDLKPAKQTEVWLLYIIWIGVILTFVVIGFTDVVKKRPERKQKNVTVNSYSIKMLTSATDSLP